MSDISLWETCKSHCIVTLKNWNDAVKVYLTTVYGPQGLAWGEQTYEMRAGSLFMLYIILANYYMENCAIYLNTWKCWLSLELNCAVCFDCLSPSWHHSFLLIRTSTHTVHIIILFLSLSLPPPLFFISLWN